MKNEKGRRRQSVQKLLVRLELWFAPWLVIVPVIVSLVLLWDWYVRGWSQESSLYDGEFMLAFILLIGNLVFDIPFLRSLRTLRKKSG
jgi:hypothetical protein